MIHATMAAIHPFRQVVDSPTAHRRQHPAIASPSLVDAAAAGLLLFVLLLFLLSNQHLQHASKLPPLIC